MSTQKSIFQIIIELIMAVLGGWKRKKDAAVVAKKVEQGLREQANADAERPSSSDPDAILDRLSAQHKPGAPGDKRAND